MTYNGTGTLRCRPHCWQPGLCMCLTLSMVLLAQGAPPADPLPVPEYSFAVGSPSVNEGFAFTENILELDFPYPETALSGTTLGLWSHLDDIDALSAGNASVSSDNVFALLFSVDHLTIGAAAPDPLLIEAGVPYNAQDQSWRGQATGDQFFSTESFSKLGQIDSLPGAVLRNNFLSRNNFDEGGTDFSAYPPTHAYTKLINPTPQDRVNATARLARHGLEESVECLYFSLSPESPSLVTLADGWEPSGAHIFFALDRAALHGACCFGGDMCEITASEDCLDDRWLGPYSTCDMCDIPEDIGACCFDDDTCEILTLIECSGSPGTWGGFWLGLDTTCNQCEEQGAAMIVSLYASREELGLVQTDNIDALIVFDVDEDGQFGGEDLVLFSLAPGSASLSMISGASAQGAAADVFVVSPNSPPVVFAPAEELGLGAPTDNIDALDLHISSEKSRQIVQYGIRSLPGDMNSDGRVSMDDITPFVAAFCGRPSFADVCPKGNWNNADSNRDGNVNGADIDAFIDLLLGGRTSKWVDVSLPVLLRSR